VVVCKLNAYPSYSLKVISHVLIFIDAGIRNRALSPDSFVVCTYHFVS
jgi:hypothetical protein